MASTGILTDDKAIAAIGLMSGCARQLYDVAEGMGGEQRETIERIALDLDSGQMRLRPSERFGPSGALVVELTKAAFEALEREARSQMDAAIGDLGKGEGDRERKKLNACADVLGAVGRSQVGWSLEDPREQASVKAVKFSAEAVAFLCEQRDATAGYIAEQDTAGEADYEHMGRECFLLHVLDRVLGEGMAA